MTPSQPGGAVINGLRPQTLTLRLPPALARRVEAILPAGERAIAERLVELAEVGARVRDGRDNDMEAT